MKRILLISLLCTLLFPLAADDFYEELENLGMEWYAFYEIIADLDVNNIEDEEALVVSLEEYADIIANTLLFVEGALESPIADATLSGYLEMIQESLNNLFVLEDEDEMLEGLKELALLVLDLCEYCLGGEG